MSQKKRNILLLNGKKGTNPILFSFLNLFLRVYSCYQHKTIHFEVFTNKELHNILKILKKRRRLQQLLLLHFQYVIVDLLLSTCLLCCFYFFSIFSFWILLLSHANFHINNKSIKACIRGKLQIGSENNWLFSTT